MNGVFEANDRLREVLKRGTPWTSEDQYPRRRRPTVERNADFDVFGYRKAVGGDEAASCGHGADRSAQRRRPGRFRNRDRGHAGHLHLDGQHDVEHHAWNHTETGNTDGHTVACFHSY